MVKRKVGEKVKFVTGSITYGLWVLPAIAVFTFLTSWAGVYPPALVERWYARGVFPRISGVAEKIADAVAFSWLDVAIPAAVVCVLLLVRRRRWRWVLNLISVLYLVLFWSWALNYHRQPLSSKLEVDSARTKPDAMKQFTMQAAAEINRLFRETRPDDAATTREEAARRVERVVQIIDGIDWPAPHRIKTSWITDGWFHAAGIDGMFNPFGHEPIISSTILDVERPFVMAHELAHVRGYPDEGDANVIAALATLMSDRPTFQYSGWLSLWLYLRNRELDKLLKPGPRADLESIFRRVRTEKIAWVSDVQRVALDWFLKANDVAQGVRSYSRVVLLTAGTEPYWQQFR
jgi:Protein of unknown function (DUF3810)